MAQVGTSVFSCLLNMALHVATSQEPQHSFSMLDKNLHVFLIHFLCHLPSPSPPFRLFALHVFMFTRSTCTYQHRCRNFLSAQKINTLCKDTYNTRPLYPGNTGGSILGLSQPKREANYSPPPSLRIITASGVARSGY
jgi:hypothetical protein